MKRNIVFLLLILLSLEGTAQIRGFILNEFRKEKSVTIGLNNRHQKILHSPSTIYSGYIGIKYGERLKHVLTLNSSILWVGNAQTVLSADPIEAQLSFIGFSEEYIFLKWGKFEFSTYLQVAIGRVFLRSTLNQELIKKPNVYPLIGGVHCSYWVLPWLDLKLGGGYQHVVQEFNVPLNGIYYKIGLGVNLLNLLDRFKINKGTETTS